MKIDPAVPPNVAKQILSSPDQGGIHPSQWNDELKDLFNASISARPLHLPESTKIAEFKNKEHHYYWVRDICGSNPNHDRVEKFRANGWDYATSEDVVMCAPDTVKQKNEIRIGDLRLMKIPEMRWREIRKSQNIAALEMISPRGRNSAPMGVNTMMPGGIPTSVVEDFSDLRAKAVVGEVSVQTDERGNVRDMQFTGNASKARIQKGD